MKSINFGQTITLIANIGVIGGILLLAYELQHPPLYSESLGVALTD